MSFNIYSLMWRACKGRWLPIMLALAVVMQAEASELAETVARIKPSIVGVGTYQPTRAPQSQLMGTGFVVGDGYHVATNAHVIDRVLDDKAREKQVIFVGTGTHSQVRAVRVLARDDVHDLALLRISGTRLPALQVGNSQRVREGERYAFTGFPIGLVLGLYPATHRGIISSVTPIATPVAHAGALTPEMIRRLKQPYQIFQLDATAYPGNSGSPLFDEKSGEVIGVINRVFVKQSKEAALTSPSGITYAIPSRYLADMIEKAGL